MFPCTTQGNSLKSLCVLQKLQDCSLSCLSKVGSPSQQQLVVKRELQGGTKHTTSTFLNIYQEIWEHLTKQMFRH